ncbi:hypothetical protein [Spirosoma areae]
MFSTLARAADTLDRFKTVLLESNGELTQSNLFTRIMQAVEHPNVGLI